MRSVRASGVSNLPMKLTWMRAAAASRVSSAMSFSGRPSSRSTCTNNFYNYYRAALGHTRRASAAMSAEPTKVCSLVVLHQQYNWLRKQASGDRSGLLGPFATCIMQMTD